MRIQTFSLSRIDIWKVCGIVFDFGYVPFDRHLVFSPFRLNPNSCTLVKECSDSGLNFEFDYLAKWMWSCDVHSSYP